MRNVKSRSLVLGVGVVLALVAGACGSDDSADQTADQPAARTTEQPATAPTEEPSAEEPAAEEPADEPSAEEPAAEEPADEPSAGEADSMGLSGDLLDLALAYTGGTAGPADDSLEPVVIGFVNQLGGDIGFPDAVDGARAAVALINNELGGIGGHPLELLECNIATEEDGLRCGIEMVNDTDVRMVTTGMLITGNENLWTAIGDAKPILISSPAAGADYGNADAVAYSSGAPGTVGTGAAYLGDLDPQPQSVAVIVQDAPTQRAFATGLVEPILNGRGITDVRLVAVPAIPTAPDVASGIQAAGETDAIYVIQPTQGCIAAYEALATLEFSPIVMAVSPCHGAAMIEHLNGAVPEGWLYTSYGYNQYIPGNDDVPESKAVDIVNHGISTYGDPTSGALQGFGPIMFANIATAAGILNQVGTEASAEEIKTALFAFKGPMWMVAGEMNCGSNTASPSLCGSHGGVATFEDGEWVAVLDGSNSGNEGINPFAPPAG